MRFRAAVACLVPPLAAALLALPADARSGGGGGIVKRYPTDFSGPDDVTFQIVTGQVDTVVFEKGVHTFQAPIEVLRRSGLVLCGATGRASDSVVELRLPAPSASAVPVIRCDEVTDVAIRDLTIRATDPNGQAVAVLASRSSISGSFARNVTLRSCRLQARIPLTASVGAEALDVADCTFTVTQPEGVGLLWQDGPALLVTRSKFETSGFSQTEGVASAAIRVFGTASAESEGERARSVILTRNRVSGNFAVGFDLADVTDARVHRNTLVLPQSLYLVQGLQAGRVGIVVQRRRGSRLPDDFEVRTNRVKGAHTGISCVETSAGTVAGNDLRGCGLTVADEVFQDQGAGLRVVNSQGACLLTIRSNDFRGLRSPRSRPAVVASPAGLGTLCFERDGENQDQDTGNRVDRGRPLHD